MSQSISASARSALYQLLSLAFLYPETGALADLAMAAQQLRETTSEIGSAELKAALDELGHQLAIMDVSGLEEEYIRVFGHTIINDCATYEGEYGQDGVLQKSGALSDLRNFYAAFGVKPNPDRKDRVDQISAELEFMQLLTAKEAYADTQGHGEDKVLLCQEAQAAFLASHLGNWVEAFGRRLAAEAGGEGSMDLSPICSGSTSSGNRACFPWTLGRTPCRPAGGRRRGVRRSRSSDQHR